MTRSLVAAVFLALFVRTGASAQQHEIIALSHTDHTVYDIDAATGRTLHTFEAVDQPHEGNISPDGSTLYIAVPSAGHVVILDAETFQQKKIIESEYFHENGQSTSPHGIAVNSDGSKIYIGTERSKVPGIVVYDTKAGRVAKKINTMLEGGHFLNIDPRTDKLYYPARTDNRVVVIDTKTDQITNIIPVEGGPVGVDFTPNGEAWIHSDYDGSVTVINERTDEVVKRIERTGAGAGRIAVSPDGRWAASTRGDSKDVAIIDTQRKEVVARVLVGGLGFPLFSPDSKRLYVETSAIFQGTAPNLEVAQKGSVTVIDMASMKQVARYDAGVAPFGGTIRVPGGRMSNR